MKQIPPIGSRGDPVKKVKNFLCLSWVNSAKTSINIKMAFELALNPFANSKGIANNSVLSQYFASDTPQITTSSSEGLKHFKFS